MFGLSKKQNKKTITEKEWWENKNRETYARELMYDWKRWDNVKELDPYAREILYIATSDIDHRDGIVGLDIKIHAQRSAYALITHQPQTHRQIIIPKYEKILTFWRFIQTILFFVICFTLCPDPELASDEIHVINGLFVTWLFIAFTAISAYCRFAKTRNSNIARERATLNAIVNEDYLAAYLRTPECAEYMRCKYTQPESPYKNAIRTYLTWYEHTGKEEYTEHIANYSSESKE